MCKGLPFKPVKELKLLYMQILPRTGIDLTSLGLQEKRIDLSPREVRYFS